LWAISCPTTVSYKIGTSTINLAVVDFETNRPRGEKSMKFNRYQGVVLAFGFAVFMLHAARTEHSLVEMIVLADMLGRLFQSR
jgi:hypothetical protein